MLALKKLCLCRNYRRSRFFYLAILSIIGLALASPFLLTQQARAIDNPDSTSINELLVFRDLVEEGDWLIYCRYNVDYTTIPDEPAEQTFQIAMYDVAGANLIATRSLKYYQHNITSLYFSAADVATKGLVWGDAYIIIVQGKPDIFALVENVNQKTRPLQPTDYKEAEDFTSYMLSEAGILETAWGITLLSGEYLNTTGATYFSYAIPGFTTIASDILYSSAYYPSTSNITHNTSYAESMHDHTGARLGAAVTDLANWLHVSEDWMAIWMVSIMYLVTAGVVYSVTKDPGVSMMVSLPVIGAAAWLGVGLSWFTILIAVGLITAVLFGIHFILGRFA